MPVVQKCLDVSNDDNIEDFYSIQNVVPNIEATYKAVVEFIKEYNVDNTDSEDDVCDMLYGVDNNQ